MLTPQYVIVHDQESHDQTVKLIYTNLNIICSSCYLHREDLVDMHESNISEYTANPQFRFVTFHILCLKTCISYLIYLIRLGYRQRH